MMSSAQLPIIPRSKSNKTAIKEQIEAHATMISHTCRIHISPEQLEINLIDHQEYIAKGSNHDFSLTPQIAYIRDIQ